MTTPKKKHLIELMIEAGVKWPDDAEYAAQDKEDNKVFFYKSKPTRPSAFGRWHFRGIVEDCSSQLPELCHNWHQTIVTREQYAEAVLMQAITGNDEQKQQLHSGVAGVTPSESIESLLAEIKAKREEHDALVAKADTLTLEITSIEQQANDKLKKYGFSLYPLAAPYKPKQPVITDWYDLRVGDVIWIGESPDTRNAPSGEYSVIDIVFYDPHQPVKIEWSGGKTWPNLTKRQWRFIRRP